MIESGVRKLGGQWSFHSPGRHDASSSGKSSHGATNTCCPVPIEGKRQVREPVELAEECAATDAGWHYAEWSGSEGAA